MSFPTCSDEIVSKVVIIANYVPDKQVSMLRLSDMFRTILEEAGIETETVRPSDRLGKLRNHFPGFAKWLGYADKYLIFPWELSAHAFLSRRHSGIVYHIIDHSNAVYSFVLRNRPRIVTCNDVLAIRSALGEIAENPIGISGKILQKAILAGLNHAPRIVCISENSARDLGRLLNNSGCLKTSTALLPLNFNFAPMDTHRALDVLHQMDLGVQNAIRGQFIVHVGGNQWYKNRKGLCMIYAHLARLRDQLGQSPIPLFLAGLKPSADLYQFLRLHDNLPIHVIMHPTNEQIQALYSLASVMLFPSLHEGFGWPIVEAMACGCPVVTTRRPPMTEVGGDAAVYIDPLDVRSSATSLNDVLEWSRAERSFCIDKGFENLKRFGRSSFVKHYMSAYNQVLAK
jgi:glycosyltransferase involved in cell wall biosynthesis